MNLKYFKKLSGFAIPLILILASLAFSYLRVIDNYELQSLDLRFKLRTAPPTSDKIVIIEIGEDSIEKLGRFPFDRNYHAILIKALSESGARMILFDFLFSEPQEHDKELEFALNQAGNVYLPFAFDIDKTKGYKIISVRKYLAKCLENFTREAKGTGHINAIPDPDGKFRRIPVFINYEETFYPSISFLMGCDYLGVNLKDVNRAAGKYISCGLREKIPLDEDSNMIINFSGKWGASYKHYSYIDILQSYFAGVSGQKPNMDFAGFKDKICIVGLTAAGTSDAHPNPFESLYPGMGLHVELINSMINKNYISRVSRAANLAILIMLSILVSLGTLKTKPIRGLFVLLLEIFFFAGAAVFLFDFFGIWIDMVCPILLMAILYLSSTLYKYIAEWKNRLVFENELGIAKKIQESFLPKEELEIEDVDIAVIMYTARQVGGDLYDFIDFGNRKFGVMIGDVSGKGIPASLFMAMTVGSFRSLVKLHSRPKDVLFNLNAKLIEESSSNLFVTMFYAIFNLEDKTVVFSNGGHLPVAHVNRDGEVNFLDVSEGMPLGLEESDY
ncbi:MAG: CHASE2 domain-containing protein, partial [Candidatus Omnitrophota bacterium]|nr:CHASE2 domain-containing protein [Candidatus Omnitrophota bacterium]